MKQETMAHPTRPYTTTHSGRHISTAGGEPSILDIAIGGSRITRFAGQGQQFFSVLAHMMWMDDLYCERLANPNPAMRLAVLLHDSGEAVTSDIPSPHKSEGQHRIQDALDARIFDRYYHVYGGWASYLTAYKNEVKSLDFRALLTEFWEVGPQQACYLDYPKPEDRDYFRWWMEHKKDLWASEEQAQTTYIHRVIHLL